MRKIKNNNLAATEIVPLVLAVVLAFSILFVGAFICGAINGELVDDYATNEASGTLDVYYWHNATLTGSRSITLPIEISALDLTNSRFSIKALDNDLDYNLTVNGNIVNLSSNMTQNGGQDTYNVSFQFLIDNSSVNATDLVLNFDWDTWNNDGSEIYIRTVQSSFFYDADFRSGLENTTFSTMRNISWNWDSAIDIVQVVIIITILSAAIGAIFLFTKFR